jgi:hypothetical protein
MRDISKFHSWFVLLISLICVPASFAGMQESQPQVTGTASVSAASNEQRLYIVQLDDPSAIAMHNSEDRNR